MTPIISGSDFRIVLAPAISVEKNVTVKSSTVSENILVCGWSLEFNVVTDVDCFLNKKQVFLDVIFKRLMKLVRCVVGRQDVRKRMKQGMQLRASFSSSSFFVQVFITEGTGCSDAYHRGNRGLINGFYADISSSYFQNMCASIIFNVFTCVCVMRSKAVALVAKVDLVLVSVSNFY